MEPEQVRDSDSGTGPAEAPRPGRPGREPRRCGSWELHGNLLSTLGCLILPYYWFVYGTGVAHESYSNVMVSDRLAGMIGGGVMVVLGAVLRLSQRALEATSK